MGGITRNLAAYSGWGAQPYDGSGASLGGGIFVMFGAELTIMGSSTFSGNSGSLDYYADWHSEQDTNMGNLGSDLFIMTGAKTTLSPGVGETIRFQGTIDDDSTRQRFVDVPGGDPLFYSNGAGAKITIGSSGNPGGTVIFQGRTGYAGGTEMNSGTLLLDGNTGSISSGSDLIFTGKSEFQYNNMNSGAGAARTQTFGTLAFNGGEGTVSSVKGNALSSTLGVGTVTRAAGATGNFAAADGVNGGSNRILVSGAAGFRSAGLFFNGSSYATVDDGGYVRGLNYGVDAHSMLSGGGTSIGGALTADSNVKLTGVITSQVTATITTLSLDSHDVTLGDGQTLTLNGILQSGGTTTISGGHGITYGGVGGETDLVIRTDTEVDFLTISSSITAPNLTKSGSGVLLLSGSNHITGTTTINDGVLVAANNTAFGTGSVAVQAGAVLVVGSDITPANPIHLEGGVFLKETAAGDAFELKASSKFEGGRNTTAEILDGTAGSATSLENSFSESSAALNDTFRLSDVYSLHGTGTDVFVLQLSAAGVDGNSMLGWLDSHGLWVNAVLGNTGTGNTGFINGAYDGNPVLGHYGVDTATGSVWAVLNHNSDFAVITVPEPGSCAFIGLVLGAFALGPRGNRADARAAPASR
ncbi:MAG: autotransporter-associated beta strand repeat-containing protein [Verrucomicrobiota bacterium]